MKNFRGNTVGCPCRQGPRCSMHGDFCHEENCAPRFIYKKEVEGKLKRMLMKYCPWLDNDDFKVEG